MIVYTKWLHLSQQLSYLLIFSTCALCIIILGSHVCTCTPVSRYAHRMTCAQSVSPIFTHKVPHARGISMSIYGNSKQTGESIASVRSCLTHTHLTFEKQTHTHTHISQKIVWFAKDKCFCCVSIYKKDRRRRRRVRNHAPEAMC